MITFAVLGMVNFNQKSNLGTMQILCTATWAVGIKYVLLDKLQNLIILHVSDIECESQMEFVRMYRSAFTALNDVKTLGICEKVAQSFMSHVYPISGIRVNVHTHTIHMFYDFF